MATWMLWDGRRFERGGVFSLVPSLGRGSFQVGAARDSRMKGFTLWLAALAARLLPAPIKGGFYRLTPLAKVIRRLLNRAAPHGLVEVTVAGGDLAGARLALDLQREKDLWLGTYEIALQAALRRFVRPGMIAYDIGANIGYVTLLLARAVAPEGKVFAFEPLPANLERLRSNLERNGYAQAVEVVAAAVGERTGRRDFWVHDSGEMGKLEGSAGREGGYRSAIRVDLVDLDTFVFDQGHPWPDLVKVDIEGGEVLALPGMKRVLLEVRPIVALESHGPRAADSAWGAFFEAGYSLHRLARGYPRLDSTESLSWKEYLLALPGTHDTSDVQRKIGTVRNDG